MKKSTNWDRYFKEQMGHPRTRSLVQEELKALRVGVELARLRQEQGLSQTQLAARVGMSAPNISRIESDPGRNMTLETLVKLFGALDHEVAIMPKKRRRTAKQSGKSK
jgi:DNA-binding Xre family transcriptional regulator